MSESQQSQSKPRPPHLRVFLCHAHEDKEHVLALYLRLVADGIKPWLDKRDLLPGQEWEIEIPKAVQDSDVVIACLSQHSASLQFKAACAC